MIISGDDALAISHLKQHLLLLRCLILVLFATVAEDWRVSYVFREGNSVGEVLANMGLNSR